jgi:hypothetical protein
LNGWRAHAFHHQVQTIGRERSLRLSHSRRPGDPRSKARQPIWQPERTHAYNDPQGASRLRACIGIEGATLRWRPNGAVTLSASVYRDGYFAHLIDLPDQQSGVEFGPRLFADSTTEYFRIFEVMRDYGMYDRTEAPQYYPPVERDRPAQ